MDFDRHINMTKKEFYARCVKNTETAKQNKRSFKIFLPLTLKLTLTYPFKVISRSTSKIEMELLLLALGIANECIILHLDIVLNYLSPLT